MIKEMLEYQEIDAELMKLERNLETNENKKQVNLMAKFVRESSERIKQLNEEADRLLKELTKLEEVENKGVDYVDKLVKQDMNELKIEELKEFEGKINSASKNLRDLEKHLFTQTEKIKSVLNEFELSKKKVFLARQKYKENKEAYDAMQVEVTPKIENLKQQLKQKEKSLNKELFEKYKELRKDGVFPMMVALNEKACGGCRTNLPSSTLEKIKENGTIRCENCRRIIYLK